MDIDYILHKHTQHIKYNDNLKARVKETKTGIPMARKSKAIQLIDEIMAVLQK